MMKDFLVALVLIFSTSCLHTEELDGKWSMTLDLQGNKVPYLLNFKKKNTVELINGPEVISLSYTIENNLITIPIRGFNAFLELKLKNNTLSGVWHKPHRKPVHRLKTKGIKSTKNIPISFTNELKLARNWELDLLGKVKTKGILNFTKKGSTIFASIITQTGDYRFLTPKIQGNDLILYGFDGAYSFYIIGKIDNQFKGTLYSGLNWNTKFEARINPKFKLKDPEQITSYSGDITQLSFENLKGDLVSLSNDVGKVQVLQIFGSWCPNCIDETIFIKQWKDRNIGLDIKFKLLAFERSPSKEHARKQLMKSIRSYSIDYPVLIGGYTKEDRVSEVLPGLSNFISFPTTIYIDKKGKVRKIFASFTGPATGKHFEKLSRDFDSFLKKLSKE